MEENEIAISLDVESMQENITRKMYKSTIAIIKATFVRFIEIITSLLGIIALIPLTIVVFFQNL